MNRFATLIWMIVVVVAAFLLYMVKYQVQNLHTQVVETERKLAEEKEALHVIAAEWAYLNRPERLRSLSAKYLSSTEVTVDQIAEIEAVPFPQQNLDAEEGIHRSRPL
jgi:hypothetical protein